MGDWKSTVSPIMGDMFSLIYMPPRNNKTHRKNVPPMHGKILNLLIFPYYFKGGWNNSLTNGMKSYRSWEIWYINPKRFIDKALSKECTSDINYTPVLAGIYMVDPPDNIDKVKVEIRQWGENMKCKCKVKAVRNSRTTLEYTEDTEPGYLWTDFYYVTKKNLP